MFNAKTTTKYLLFTDRYRYYNNNTSKIVIRRNVLYQRFINVHKDQNRHLNILNIYSSINVLERLYKSVQVLFFRGTRKHSCFQKTNMIVMSYKFVISFYEIGWVNF